MEANNQSLHRVTLSMTPHVGSRRARQLIQHFGSAEAVLTATEKELMGLPGISKKICQSLHDKATITKAQSELDFIRKSNIKLLYYLEDEYPEKLRHYDDAPICLYYRGNVPLNGRKHVSIIGTRTPTARGKWICEKLVEDLKSYDVTIISGLAYGVDITAHKASLKNGLPTVGVVAHGLDTIYPSVHKEVARKMVRQGGVLTEFVRTTKADRDRFPARNRIIAGISDAVIVVESKESGGSMITANFANDYSKDVFAIPGRVDDETSRGCNKLIKEHKAFLIDSAEDLIKTMRWEPKEGNRVQRKMFLDLKREEQKIVDCIRMGVDNVDGLSNALAYSQSELSVFLLELEMNGVIKALPGNRYLVLD